ncbi:MAG: RND transporter, partial [Thermocrispum sp.]
MIPSRVLNRLRRLRPPSWRHVAGVAVAAIAGALVIGGLLQARVETSVSSFLPTDDPAAESLQRVAETFGGDPVVVLLEAKQKKSLLDPPRLSRLLRLEGELAGQPDVASVYGPATSLNQLAGRAQDFVAELSGRRDGIRARAVSDARKTGA